MKYVVKVKVKSYSCEGCIHFDERSWDRRKTCLGVYSMKCTDYMTDTCYIFKEKNINKIKVV